MLTVVLNNIVNPKAMSKKENKEQDILKAAEMLFAVLEGEALKERNVTLDFELKVRQSTR